MNPFCQICLGHHPPGGCLDYDPVTRMVSRMSKEEADAWIKKEREKERKAWEPLRLGAARYKSWIKEGNHHNHDKLHEFINEELSKIIPPGINPYRKKS